MGTKRVTDEMRWIFFCFLSQIDLCLSVGIELNSRDSHAELRRRRKRKNGMNCWFIPQSDAEQRERDIIVFLFSPNKNATADIETD